MWSTALKIILTTLRILAPATLLTLFWGHNSFLFRILKQIDIAIKTIIYSSEDQKESIVKWLSETGPIKVDTLDTVWHHGWIVCGVLDAAMPGACAGHPPTTLSMKHAQTIADHYLGVEPVFTKQELESEDKLSKYQEWKLAQYLDRIREALSRIPTPVSKPCSQRTSPEIPHFTMDYTAKGSGLAVAQINSKMFFKIYPTAQQSLEPGEIKVLIKGPKDKYGLALIPPIMGKAQSLRQKLLDLEQKPQYTHSKLPLIQGTTYLRSYGKNDMSKMYHIPKSQYDIKIEAEIRPEYAKVGYTVDSEGRYEIFITSRGQNIVGSPFTVPASYNIIDDLENDSSCLEDGEEIDIIDSKTDRKVVLRIVDFVSEKMLLKEDGELEKITDEQAEQLMKTEKEDPVVFTKILDSNDTEANTNKIQEQDKKVHFRLLSNKLIIVLRFCRVLKEKKIPEGIESTDYIKNTFEDHKEIPDLINSTFNETYLQQQSISERLDSRSYEEERKSLESEYFDTNEKSLHEIERNSLEKIRSLSPNNPFINDIIRENTASTSSTCALDFPSLDDIPIKILIEEDNEEQGPVNTNPFIDPEILQIERPKTPVLKIITGEVKNRDTIYVDPRFDKMEEDVKSNEFINPFYLHGHLYDVEDTPVADFIIGAPVTLPPIVKTSTPEPTVESIMYTCPEASHYESSSDNNITRTEYSSELNVSNLNVNDLEEVTPKKQEDEAQNVTIKRDMWDSAYVSIDDSNSSPDSNNNDNLSNEQPIKNRFSPSEMKTEEDFSNMGPAEQELWETCLGLNEDKPNSTETVKNMKLDYNRTVFTPIQEENDRSVSVDPKDFNLAKPFLHSNDNEQVSVALNELNNAFYDYLSHTEDNFDTKIRCSQLTDKQNAIQRHEIVDSASEKETDVMRHKFNRLEGAISEVQSKATELDSASQGLHQKDKSTLFRSEGRQSSIVLEKKKYWDQKIKEIEDTSKQQQHEKKLKVSIKHNKNNDSLTRRKGKQIVKNFLHAGDSFKPALKDTFNIPENEIKSTIESNIEKHETKKEEQGMNALLKTGPEKTILKEKTKDNEVSTNDLISMNSKADIYFETCKDKYEQKSKKYISNTETYNKVKTENASSNDKQDKDILNTSTTSIPVNVEATSHDHVDKINSLKQDYTEEVFKAFETCPKRFFGTSRKRILNKIDSFLGIHKPTDETPSLTSTSKESGIVSNRVTLFHSISNVEELVWKRKNFQNSKDENIVSTPVSSQTTNEFKASDAPVLDQKGTKSKVREDKNFETKRDKPDITNKDSLNRQNLNNGKKTSVTKTQETNKLNDIMTTQANLKNQVNDAIRRFKRNDSDCNDTPVVNSTTKVVENISEYQNNGQKKVYSVKPLEKIAKSKNILRKSSFSRSDMDIFQKVNHLDKHKSYEDLPKINIKNFISIFETATKYTESPGKPVKQTERLKNKGFSKGINDESVRARNQIPIAKENPSVANAVNNSGATPQPPLRLKKAKSLSKEKLSNPKINENPIIQADTTDENYISLNDIDIEIIEKPPDTISQVESDANDEFANPIDYKSRFNKAKDFFKSLEELRDRPVLKKEKACTTSIESLDSDTQKKNTRNKIKAFSLPSTELSQVWDEMNLTQDEPNKLIKISEKFQVEHLFNDVVEGKLSRRGSLRGIPHKKAVLETFKSMENVSEPKLSPYEISLSQLTDFAKKNKIINAQTCLTEYPYLPTTDPSKYHSRIDAKASGLISFKELVNSKPRRNSVPDLRLKPRSTLDL